MKKIFDFLIEVVDVRQPHKVIHSLSDIVMIVFFAHLTKCDNWEEIHLFARRYESILKQLLSLENGIPSKGTIRRVMKLIHPSVLEEINHIWNELFYKSR